MIALPRHAVNIDSLRAGYPMSTFDSAAYPGLSAFFDTGGDSRQHTRNETQRLPVLFRRAKILSLKTANWSFVKTMGGVDTVRETVAGRDPISPRLRVSDWSDKDGTWNHTSKMALTNGTRFKCYFSVTFQG